MGIFFHQNLQRLNPFEPSVVFHPETSIFFFLSGLSFTNIHKSQDCRGRGGHSLTPLCHSHPLHRYLDISRAITKEILPLQSVGKRTGTGNPPSYALLLYAIEHDWNWLKLVFFPKSICKLLWKKANLFFFRNFETEI